MSAKQPQDRTPQIDTDDWLGELPLEDMEREESMIYNRNQIDHRKRRRIEMMQEERELKRLIGDVFDED